MTSKRRHPAQTSRILATGLSAATLLSIVAVLGAPQPLVRMARATPCRRGPRW